MGVSRRNRNVHYKFAESPQIRKTLAAQCSDGQRYCKGPLRNAPRNHMRMHLSFTYQKGRRNDPGGSMSGRIDGLMYFDDDLQDFCPETAPRLLCYRESNQENRISTCLARMRAVVWTGGKCGKSAKRGVGNGERTRLLSPSLTPSTSYIGDPFSYYILYCL